MFLEKFNNNGSTHLRLVKSVRIIKDDGNPSIRKNVILNLGSLSKYDDGKPDFFNRLRNSFKNGTALIPALEPHCSAAPREKYRFTIEENTPECVGHPKLFSHCLIEQILCELGVIQTLSSYKGFSKIKYDLLGFFRLLIYGRILSSSSKIQTTRQNDNYFDPILDDFYEYNVYDTLDFILKHKKQLITRINTSLTKAGERQSEIIFYDVTNFFFETDEPDEDIVDDDGKVIEKGIRKMGVSKENRKQPIVQMGMFVDSKGYPISLEIFSGNTLDHLTVRQALTNNLDGLIKSRYIFIGDRGLCNYVNLKHLVDNEKGFIVSKSIRKSTKKEQKWILNPEGYVIQSASFKYKSKITTVKFKDADKNKQTLKFKTVCYFSKKFYDREMKENKSFLEFLAKLESSPTSFRITARQAKSIKPFLKKKIVNEKTGEVLEADQLRLQLDYEKINKYKQLFGYYQIITSELEMEPQDVIEKYHLLPIEENDFRMLKNALEARPMYVRTKDHIEAHLLLCLISLIVIRVIQNKIVSKQPPNDEKLWELGLSSERIQAALNKWTVDKFPGELYRFNYVDDPDLKRILDAFDIQIPQKLFRKMELKNLKTRMKIFNK